MKPIAKQTPKPKIVRKKKIKGGDDAIIISINHINEISNRIQDLLTTMNNKIEGLCNITNPQLKTAEIRHIITLIEQSHANCITAKVLQQSIKNMSHLQNRPITVEEQQHFREEWSKCLRLMLKYNNYFNIPKEVIANPIEPTKILQKPAWKICRLLYILKTDWDVTTRGSGCLMSKQKELELDDIVLSELETKLEIQQNEIAQDNIIDNMRQATYKSNIFTPIVFTQEEEEQYMKELNENQVGGKKKRTIKKKL